MKILKPTLTKVIIFIIVIVVVYFCNTLYISINKYKYIDLDCPPTGEDCNRYISSQFNEISKKMILIDGLPIAIVGYVLAGVVVSRRKKIK